MERASLLKASIFCFALVVVALIAMNISFQGIASNPMTDQEKDEFTRQHGYGKTVNSLLAEYRGE